MANSIANELMQGNYLNLVTIMSASPIQPTKEWHTRVTPDLRDHLVYKIVQKMLPHPNSQVRLNVQMHKLVDYAKKMEGDFYGMANSMSEYYNLIAETVFRIQENLEGKGAARGVHQQQSVNNGCMVEE